MTGFFTKFPVTIGLHSIPLEIRVLTTSSLLTFAFSSMIIENPKKLLFPNSFWVVIPLIFEITYEYA